MKNDPFKALAEHIHEMKNIRIVSKPETTITEAFYYKDNVYLAHGYYANTCLCGESSSGAQCQKYVVEPTTSDDKIPLTIHIFNAEDCSSPASITYRLVIPSSGVSTVESDCDAGADLMDLPYKVQIGSVNAYESFGTGELNLMYGRKEDCSENLFSSYFFSAARKVIRQLFITSFFIDFIMFVSHAALSAAMGQRWSVRRIARMRCWTLSLSEWFSTTTTSATRWRTPSSTASRTSSARRCQSRTSRK